MVTILSLLLGLVVGVQPIEWAVTGDVASVEIVLDGQTIGTLHGEPWVLACDFGEELAPHYLVAIGRDTDGVEVSRAVRRINLPQHRSQMELLVRDLDSPAPRGEIVWRSVDGDAPTDWQISLDGRPFDVEDPASFTLPAHDASTPHVLEAVLLFGRHQIRTELAFGAQLSGTSSTELTALVYDLAGGSLPKPGEMKGWFSSQGEELEVAAVERPGADVLLVQESSPDLWNRLVKLRREHLKSSNRSPVRARAAAGLKHDDGLRVILPLSEAPEGAASDFFISTDFSELDQGPTSTGVGRKVISGPRAEGILASLPYPPEGPIRGDAPWRTADAVAVAAQVASAKDRARAVVLIKHSGVDDRSYHFPERVRRYLHRLQVPLIVWTTDPREEQGPWGELHDISTDDKFLRAALGLRATLDRQIVVWVSGRHLPHEVTLSTRAEERLRPATESAPQDLSQFEESDEFAPWIADNDRSIPVGAEEAQVPSAAASEAIEIADEVDPTELETAESFVGSIDVRLVEVEVTVTGPQGLSVHGLRADDFELFEDGEPVPIHHFVAPKTIETGDASPTVAPAAGRVPSLIIFLETGSLNLPTRKRLAASLREALAAEGLSAPETGFRTMLATYDRSLEIQTPLSEEPKTLRETLHRIESGELAQTAGPDERSRIVNEIVRVQRELQQSEPGGPRERQAEADRQALLAEMVAVGKESAHSIRGTLDALRHLTASLGGVEGRKILLYVGDGLEITPARELFDEAEISLELTPNEIARLQSEARGLDLQSDFDALFADANARGVTIHTLAPRNRGGADVVERAAAGTAGLSGRVTGTRQELVKSATCLLSIETGGLCQAGGTDPGRLLVQTRDDLNGSYTLAFAPDHKADGEYRRLEVRLASGSGATGSLLRHREGYTDIAPADRVRDRLAAALLFGDEDNEIGVTLETSTAIATGTKGLQMIPLDVRIPVAKLGVLPLEGGDRFGVKARILVATRDESGATTATQEFPITFQVDREQLESSTELIYSHKIHLTLSGGDHRVAIGMWDEIGQTGAFLSRSIEGI